MKPSGLEILGTGLHIWWKHNAGNRSASQCQRETPEPGFPPARGGRESSRLPALALFLMDIWRKSWELCPQPPLGKKDLKFCFVLFLPPKPHVSNKNITQEHLLAETKTRIAQQKYYYLPPPPSWARGLSRHLCRETKGHHSSTEWWLLPLARSQLRQWGELSQNWSQGAEPTFYFTPSI